MSNLKNLASMLLLFTVVHASLSVQNSMGTESNDFILEGTNETNYRLSTYVRPSYYVIRLMPNLDEASFEGESSISIVVSVNNKKTITLHAKNLEIDENYTSLVDANMQAVKAVHHSIDNVTDFLTITFANPIAAGSYWLNFKYTGQLNGNSKGFHRTSYVNENGQNVWVASTHFEPFHARQAFPCFDEPAMKAKFNISIKHADKYTALSNMPAIKTTNDKTDSDKVLTNFDVTPVMSTYLVAFVVSDLKNISSKDGKVRCWSRESKIQNCRFALDIGQKELTAMTDYMGVGPGIPKMDQVAIPGYSGLAVENWGLIIYTEERLLNEEGVTTPFLKQQIATTVAHELVHQWFGNLISVAWWNHLWLKEGFANYFQYYITNEVIPDWRVMDQMVTENLQAITFRIDEYQPEHSIKIQVNNPSEIIQYYDSIAYYISGCVIRMISNALAEEIFQAGLRRYATNLQYSAATADDLIDALASTAKNLPKNMTLKEFLNTWKDQIGFPIIHVSRLSSAPGYVSINQTRYLSLDKKNTVSPELWWIPINFATESNPNFNDTRASHWLHPSRTAQEISLKLSSNEWIIFNKQETGYYRVNYDRENWALIADYLDTPNYKNIHVLNRAQLLDDSLSLLQNEYLDDATIFLDISRYLVKENDYVPWQPAFRAFEYFDEALKYTDAYSLFKLYLLKLLEKVEDTVGYNVTSEDDVLTNINRINIIKWACKLNSAKCLDATHKSLIDHISGTRKISPDLEEAIFCAGLRTANATIWNKMFDMYLEDKSHPKSILSALGCSLNQRIIKSFLAKVLDADFMKRIDQDDIHEDYIEIHVAAVAKGSEAGVDIIMNFLKENIQALNKTSFKKWYDGYVYSIMDHINTETQIERVNSIINALSNNTEDRIHRLKRLALSQPQRRIKWLNKYETQIQSFLMLQHLTAPAVKPE